MYRKSLICTKARSTVTVLHSTGRLPSKVIHYFLFLRQLYITIISFINGINERYLSCISTTGNKTTLKAKFVRKHITQIVSLRKWLSASVGSLQNVHNIKTALQTMYEPYRLEYERCPYRSCGCIWIHITKYRTPSI